MGYPAATDGGLRAPTRRAPETLHRRPSSAAIPPEFHSARRPSVLALAQQGWGRLFFSARRAWRSGGKEGRGEPPAHRNTGRCALTASRKNGSPAPAAFSLAPQLRFQSNASRRCANLRTGKNQLSACRGSKFSKYRGGELPFSPAG
jgi:hypothetical protein